MTAMVHPAGENDDLHISASEERMLAEIAQIVWEACGPDPAEFELERLPSFEVDVQRRWPSRSAVSATGPLGRSSGSGAAARNRYRDDAAHRDSSRHDISSTKSVQRNRCCLRKKSANASRA